MGDGITDAYRLAEEINKHEEEMRRLEKSLQNNKDYLDILAAEKTTEILIIEKLEMLKDIRERRLNMFQAECSKHNGPMEYWEYRRVTVEDLKLTVGGEERQKWARIKDMIRSLF